MDPDFNQYWNKIQNNEASALEEVYNLSFRYLLKYASAITGNIQEAEEVVQDVFLNTWQNRSTLSINISFRRYLLQSVHNHSLNVIRHHKTRKESVNKTGSEKTWQFISDTFDLNDNFIDRIYCNETEDIIEKAISNLPDQCKKVFRLSRSRSMKNSEIAEQLYLSENTVKSHIYTALQRISAALKTSE
jgi:RNA polymerase sigma-70 factor (ECF subfamily)